MNLTHPFWLILTIAAVVWYSTITVYVSFKGVFDIKHMLRNLREGPDAPKETKPEPEPRS